MRIFLDLIFKKLYLAAFGLVVFLIFIDLSYLGLNTADASLYLSTAENIANHTGFVVSDNLYQYFNTLYHPAFPYYQPLYSLFASLFINHGGIVRVIQINILIFVFNAMFVLYIIQRLMPTKFNILFALYLVLSMNFYLSALYAWTEQFHFFCLFIVCLLFLKYSKDPRQLIWLGALNGVLMLIRVAHFYNFAAFLAVLMIGKDPLRRKFEKALLLAGGFILTFGLYQLFCLLRYHVFYPECPRSAMSYELAHHFTGIIYSPNAVGIHVILGSIFTIKNLANIAHHIGEFCQQMPIISYAIFIYYFLAEDKKQDGGGVKLFFLQGLFTIAGYSFTFYSVTRFPNYEIIRYSLIPYVLLSLGGWYCLFQALSFSNTLAKKILCGFFWVCLIYSQAIKCSDFGSSISHRLFWHKPFYMNLKESYGWIDKNLPERILVASADDQQNYFMHRPFVSLPPGRSFNCPNLTLFNKIYSPDYYLLSRAVPDRCFALIPHTIIHTNDIFRLYKVTK